MNANLTDRQMFNTLLREDFAFFVTRTFATVAPNETYVNNWHINAMAHVLEQLVTGDLRRAVITLPPRHLKSIACSIAYPAFVLGHRPSTKILVASYGAELALDLARKFRRVMEAEWYRDAFPELRTLERNVEGELRTRQGGLRKALTVGGAATGLGGDILIVDDLMKAGEAQSAAAREEALSYFTGTLHNRQNAPITSRILVVGQRLHEDDVPGYCVERGYHHLNLPAIAEEEAHIPLTGGRIHHRRIGDVLSPNHVGLAQLEEFRQTLRPYEFSAQYQQNPTPPDSNFVRWDEIQRFEEFPDHMKCELIVQSWDTATTAQPNSDYSVCMTWGYYRSSWHLLDVFREKQEFDALLSSVRRLRDHWQPDCIIIEHAASGVPIIQSLNHERRAWTERREIPWALWSYTPSVDKVTRYTAECVKLTSGFAKFPLRAPWLPDLKREMLGFPNSRHDDQIDALTQFLEVASSRRLCRPGQRRP